MVSIREVVPGSPAARLGLRPGDGLVAIDGVEPRDVIDYQLLIDEAHLLLDIQTNGSVKQVPVDKIEGEPLGLTFDRPVFDRVKICRNRCIFCFIEQLPRGLRGSLYLKDDDYRLSFLDGNFITLTNLDNQEVDRIVEQRLSPLFVSVHSTDPQVRDKMMGTSNSKASLEALRRISAAGIQLHIQIVLCPGWNDGRILVRTLHELEKKFPSVASVGVVPVGLTGHRRGNGAPALRPVGAGEALETVRLARSVQARRRAMTGDAWLYLADEIYLTAGQPIPPAQYYDDFPQLENGIGLSALFLRDAERRLRKARPVPNPYEVTFLTGKLAAPLLRRVGGKLERKLGIEIDVLAAEHLFFGGNVGVAPLLTGTDLLSALEGRKGTVWVPDRMVNADGLLLDGLTLEDVQAKLSCRLIAVPTEGNGLVAFAEEYGSA